MNWTKEQYEAIHTDNANLLISAAAGSGKTAVLTERIVRLVREGVDIDRFLIVTFTEAATSEMKRRIAARLFAAAQEEETPEAGERLRMQALQASRANISTLHAFCLYLLRRNFHMLELDPAFRTADGLLSGMLREEAMREAAAALYEANDQGFFSLLEAFGGKEEELFDSVGRLYDFMMAQPSPEEWLTQAAGAYTCPDAALMEHPAMQALLGTFQEQVAAQEALILQARTIVPAGKERVCALLDDDLSQLRALRLSKDIDTLRARLHALSFGRFSWPGKDDIAQKRKVQDLRDAVKKQIKAMQDALPRTMEEEAAHMRMLAPQVLALCDFVRAFHAAYAAAKQARGVVDFADMEHLALRVLEQAGVRDMLRRRFKYIFVDEYQDSSHIQECIIEQVRRENNLFLVGDVKQSIYRFRQADPGLFLGRLRAYPRLDEGKQEGGAGASIYLNCNFRSARPVLDAVNGVFARIMSEQVGELTYDESAALQHPPDAHPPDEHPPDEHPPDEHPPDKHPPDGRDTLEGCELHSIEKKLEVEQETDTEELTDAQAEAAFAARRIRELMCTARYTDPKTGTPRALRYADFTVLLRAQRPVAQAWAQTLSGMGIPAYVQLTGGYFDAIEVQVFLNVLRIIDNERQDIPLLSALRSPIFGFTLDDLVQLRTAFEADTLYEQLMLCAAAQDALSARARDVFSRMDDWRKEQLLLPLHIFFAQLLDETGFYDCVGALPAGQERQANLDALVQRAEEYASLGGASDLGSFLAYMDGAANTAQMGAAQTGAADVVRVLSMHAAKGLEYPVVFLAGLGRRFTFLTRAQQERIVYARACGMGVRMIKDGVVRDTLLRRAIVHLTQRQQLAEEMRILYVGMTRARSRLILIGCIKDAQERFENPVRDITPAFCAGASCYMDWLMAVSAQCDDLPGSVHKRHSILAAAEQHTTDEGNMQAELPEQIQKAKQKLEQHFSWRYPHMGATEIPTKRSVSELIQSHARELVDMPAFAQEEQALSPAQRGEAVHTLLREIRLASLSGQDAALRACIAEEIARLTRGRMLSALQADAIDAAAVEWFLQSEMGMRLRNAERVERELEFSMELPASALLETQLEEPMLLQGVIDCCFMEKEGAWTLLDYKTDHVQRDLSAQEAAQAHVAQLRLYAQALHMLTGMPVKEGYVVLLQYKEIVKLSVSDDEMKVSPE